MNSGASGGDGLENVAAGVTVAVCSSVLTAIGSGLISGVYYRGKLDVIQKTMGDRIDTLEKDRDNFASTCEQQRDKMLADLRSEVCSIVKQAVSDAGFKHAEQLGCIRTDLAVLVALHGETQKDIGEIFQRLNVREVDLGHDPERRRHAG